MGSHLLLVSVTAPIEPTMLNQQRITPHHHDFLTMLKPNNQNIFPRGHRPIISPNCSSLFESIFGVFFLIYLWSFCEFILSLFLIIFCIHLIFVILFGHLLSFVLMYLYYLFILFCDSIWSFCILYYFVFMLFLFYTIWFLGEFSFDLFILVCLHVYEGIDKLNLSCLPAYRRLPCSYVLLANFTKICPYKCTDIDIAIINEVVIREINLKLRP